MAFPVLSHIPEILHSDITRYWEKFQEQCTDEQQQALQQTASSYPTFWRDIATVWAGSQYVAESCCHNPALLLELLQSGDLYSRYSPQDYELKLAPRLLAVENEEQLMKTLRGFRRREMLRIIWRDFTRAADTEETTGCASSLADACIGQALHTLHGWLAQRYGEPYSADAKPEPQRMLVLAMGKLGAYELNISSDVDLIFTFPSEGETLATETRSARPITNQEFFTKLARQLIKVLDTVTAEGFVFRVDMRLRPYGESGALVLSFDAMEDYYQTQGRDWERYAMIKARVVGADSSANDTPAGQLLALLRPFIYRRYIDFSAIESLRTMKAMILREVQRKGLETDIKLGEGGIRETEFIVQSFQLIRGGRDVDLQQRSLLPVLAMLGSKRLLPAQAVAELRAAYLLLRNTEHAIQGYRDAQSQALPTIEQDRARIAFIMGAADWPAFQEILEGHRYKVRKHFRDLISDPEDSGNAKQQSDTWAALWRQLLRDEPGAALEQLQKAGFVQAETVLTRLTEFQSSPRYQCLQQIGRERVDAFMPLLLELVAKEKQSAETLLRIMPLLESVMRRTAYLVLLVENPDALQQLVMLCGASAWIAQQLVTQPVLMDELLNQGTLYQPPGKAELHSDLQQQILRLSWDDLEAHMEMLRYFKLAHSLRVAASEVTGTLPLMKASDYLTWVAEVILGHVLALAWHHLTGKHGHPQHSPGVVCDPGFIVVGYGKLGGLELGYSSDLDLVFIYDADPDLETDSDKPINNVVFYSRLVQRMIHILTAQTPLGKLYEIDLRLRPSGASGLTVSSLTAFRDYQLNKAWTWEHQALVRARVVAGCPVLGTRFAALRTEILTQPRELHSLQQEVITMRQKMREHLLAGGMETADTPLFHLKQGYGGIVDVEFIVQYAVLAWSHEQPELARWTDNIRILESLQLSGHLTTKEAAQLTEAYKAFRSAAHLLALQNQEGIVDSESFRHYRKAVLAKWEEYFGRQE